MRIPTQRTVQTHQLDMASAWGVPAARSARLRRRDDPPSGVPCSTLAGERLENDGGSPTGLHNGVTESLYRSVDTYLSMLGRDDAGLSSLAPRGSTELAGVPPRLPGLPCSQLEGSGSPSCDTRMLLSFCSRLSSATCAATCTCADAVDQDIESQHDS